MNKHLQCIISIIQQDEPITADQRLLLDKAAKDLNKDIEIMLFKLDRTEKVKRTTAILLEETIEELEQKRKSVELSHAALEKSLDDLKAAQAQLIQSEKMASLGELTAGIAHEIQNPLNFINNFSEINLELIEEVKSQKSKLKSQFAAGKLVPPQANKNEELDFAELNELLEDLAANEEKINHHGKRADAIVKGMLQHSRNNSGQKLATDINALCEEYLRLSYHGLRAKDKNFNARLDTDFDEHIGKINIIPQDIGRVIMNLLTNAFYAVNERSNREGENYKPSVSIQTKKTDNMIAIRVSDNGNGIPQNIVDKIFQPFFTTKPTGQGTGLGLSLSYDIIKAHGGELKLETKEGEGTTFIISLSTINL